MHIAELAARYLSLPLAVMSWALWILVFLQYRASFAGIFVARA